MKKTYYYKFIPSKAEEVAAEARNKPFQTTRELVEIRDLYPAPVMDPFNPWQIRKVVTDADVLTGKLALSHNEVFEYVFRYWSLEMCNYVLAGHKFNPVVWDHSDENNPVRYHKDGIYIEQAPCDTFALGWLDLVRKSNINPRDQIGLYWQSSGTDMRKTYYQNFLPTKADEEVANASKTPLQTARLLVEIRDMNPPPAIDPFNPWQIKKVVTDADVLTGKLSLSHHDVFEYVFRYWNLEMCNYVLAGNKFMPVIWDHSDEKNPVRYHKEELFIELGPWDTFVLGWLYLVRKSNINPRDEIGLYWQSRSGTLQFKVLRRGY